MKTAYITIGNSDGKLSQAEWSRFTQELRTLVDQCTLNVHGVWYSAPDSPWQNMCVCVEVEDIDDKFKELLALLAGEFRQDSIALAIATVEFVEGKSLQWPY